MGRREQAPDKKDRKDKQKKHGEAPPKISSPRSPSQRKKSSKKESTMQDTFEARRSTRVDANKYRHHDGDCWQETLAVCEQPATKQGIVKMKIRSYYLNTRTGDRVWDEPPSGASKICPATQEMRNMAEVQLQEMQITFGTALNEPPQRRKGLFRSNKKNSTDTPQQKFKIKYKPGSFLSKVKKEPPKTKVSQDDSMDPQVQKAIALSMNGVSTDDEPVIRSEVTFRDDEMQMIMAMSLSEQEAKKHPQMSEEEMLQRAIQESRQSTSTPHAAAMPIKDEFSGLGLSHSSSSEGSRRGKNKSGVKKNNSDDSSLDKKMPAKPTKSISLQDHRERSKEGASVEESSKARSSNSASSSGRSSGRSRSSSLDKKLPAKPTKTISVRDDRERSSGSSQSRSSPSLDKKAPPEAAKSISVHEHRERSKEPAMMARVKIDGKAARESRARPSQSSSSGDSRSSSLNGTRSKPTTKEDKSGDGDGADSKPRLTSNGSKRVPRIRSPQSASSGSSWSSLTDGTRDSKPRSSRQLDSVDRPSSRSSLSASSGHNRRMTERTRSEDSSTDKTLPTKPAPSGASRYGKSVRPSSSKNLTITRSSSEGSRHSLNAARERAVTKKSTVTASRKAPPTAEFSPYGDTTKPLSLNGGGGVTIKEYSRSRSARRSVFGGSSRNEFQSEDVSIPIDAVKDQGMNGAKHNSSRRRSSRTG